MAAHKKCKRSKAGSARSRRSSDGGRSRGAQHRWVVGRQPHPLQLVRHSAEEAVAVGPNLHNPQPEHRQLPLQGLVFLGLPWLGGLWLRLWLWLGLWLCWPRRQGRARRG